MQDDNKTYKNPIAEQEHFERPEWMPVEAVGIDITNNWLDADQDLQMPEYLLTYKDVGLFPRGGIQAVTGHKKNGKTMLETLLMVAVLKAGDDMNGLRYALADKEPNPKVLFIDTEQDNSYSLMVQRRVHYLMGWDFRTNNERFRILNLMAEQNASIRWFKTLWAIFTKRPTFVVLDGIRDVTEDINDSVVCTAIIKILMKVAQNMKVSIVNALHYNPGPDKKMRGHLGTELGNRVTDSLECVKHKENGFVKFEVNNVDPRGMDMETMWFEVVNVGDNKFGIPRIMTKDEAKEDETEDPKVTELRKLFDMVDIPANGIRYTELQELLKALGVSEHTAQTKISKATAFGVLYKDTVTGRYYKVI